MLEENAPTNLFNNFSSHPSGRSLVSSLADPKAVSLASSFFLRSLFPPGITSRLSPSCPQLFPSFFHASCIVFFSPHTCECPLPLPDTLFCSRFFPGNLASFFSASPLLSSLLYSFFPFRRSFKLVFICEMASIPF